MIDLNELAKTLSPANRGLLEAFALELQRQEAEPKETTPDNSDPTPTAVNGNGKHPGSWIEVKTINGRQYEYYRWREGKILKSKYKGRA